MNEILKLENVNSYYGSSHILFDENISLAEGRSVCILGRNGVGKSTTIKTIMGLMNPQNKCRVEGKVIFDGKDITHVKPHRIAQMGIAYVPQGRHIFPTLTVKENLLIAKRKGVDGSEDWTMERIYDLFPRLQEREGSFGGKLSGGEQQMLAVARGLMQNPRLLLLDEICEGLAPIVVKQLAEIIGRLLESDVSILVAEQSVNFARSVSEDCYILEKGTPVLHKAPKDLTDEDIQKYLGM